MIFHKSIWKYVAAIIEYFNDVTLEYKLSTGEKVSRNIPLIFSSKEKMNLLDRNSVDQILSGNLNVLPRGSVTVSSIVRDMQRFMNKNTKTNIVKDADHQMFQYNSVPFNFTFEVEYICRGMTEATCILEQICPRFNPNIVLDVWDAEFLSEPTKIPVQLLDTSIQIQEYEETSTNLATVNLGLQLNGWLYQAIKDDSLIRQMLVNFSHSDSEGASDVMDWDVSSGEASYSGLITSNDLDLKGLMVPELKLGEEAEIILDLKSKKAAQSTFVWSVFPKEAAEIVKQNAEKVTIIPKTQKFEIKCSVEDVFKNVKTISKIISVKTNIAVDP